MEEVDEVLVACGVGMQCKRSNVKEIIFFILYSTEDCQILQIKMENFAKKMVLEV